MNVTHACYEKLAVGPVGEPEIVLGEDNGLVEMYL